MLAFKYFFYLHFVIQLLIGNYRNNLEINQCGLSVTEPRRYLAYVTVHEY